MRFMSLYRTVPSTNPPSEKLMAQMGQLIEEMTKAGTLIATGGWSPTTPCTIVSSTSAGLRVTDGPYSEAKEVIAGYAILEAGSRDEAIALTKRFLEVAGEGSCELRQLGGPGSECG
jgi:hypothetical protein